ncbi:MAG: YlxM family DNA-binding protein [Candidatus Ventricola sp.]
MDDRLEIGWLFAFYGPLLTDRQRSLLSLYCEEDFSLSEIAAREGISRQGVYDAVRRGARQLEAYERQLGLLARYRRLTQGLEEGLEALRDAPGEQAQRAREILARLLSEEEE